ncbi:hypothetical protein ACJJTC_013418 [Scirpophaga incertulas]
MAVQDKKKLMSAKGQCKASITRLERYFADQQHEYTADDIIVRKKDLIETYNKYQELLLELQLLGESTDKEEEETEVRYYNLMATFEHLLKSPSQGKLVNFKLHKWMSNYPEVLSDIPNECLGMSSKNLDRDESIFKILGLSYNAKDDV